MPPYCLRLMEDRFAAAGGYPRALGGGPRVLYVAEGRIAVHSRGVEAMASADTAWFGVGDCTATAGSEGARVLRYELLNAPGDAAAPGGTGIESRPLLEQGIDLDPSGNYLMRCDRVDFDAGGEALPHGHRGGGIRCLLQGRLDVKVADGPFRTMRPGDAWFESGRDPVHAVASKHGPTSFIRVSILPREIQGKSSIVYVDQTTAARSRPRRYTVFVDEPIEI